MKRVALALALAAIASAAPAQERDRPPGGMRRGYANPTAVIAAEIAFNRMAQEKGQWTAYRDYAAVDAWIFTPHRVLAQSWLKKRTDPSSSLIRRPHHIVMSCDGQMAASLGQTVAPDNANGRYITVWHRDTKGRYKWVLTGPDAHDAARTDAHEAAIQTTDPEFITTAVAECNAGPADPDDPPFVHQLGKCSTDGTLCWAVATHPATGDRLRVYYRSGTGFKTIYEGDYPPGPAG